LRLCLSYMTPQDGFDDISQTEIFHILGNDRRRYIAYILKERGAMELSDLVEEVAAIEQNKPVDKVRGEDIKRVYASLYQTHLPQMDESGFINYDRDRRFVEATDLLLSIQLELKTSNEPSEKILKIIQGSVVGVTTVILISTVFPNIVGFTVGRVTIALVMPLLSIILVLVYYIERITSPTIEGVSINEEGDDA